MLLVVLCRIWSDPFSFLLFPSHSLREGGSLKPAELKRPSKFSSERHSTAILIFACTMLHFFTLHNCLQDPLADLWTETVFLILYLRPIPLLEGVCVCVYVCVHVCVLVVLVCICHYSHGYFGLELSYFPDGWAIKVHLSHLEDLSMWIY